MTEKHSVLIVDDAEVDRYILKRKLKRTGLDLTILEMVDGSQALAFLMQPIDVMQQAHPDINSPITIFLDINMPNMDGWGLLEAITQNQAQISLRPIVVLMYTSSNDPTEKERAMKNELVAAFITKDNIDVDDLTSTIESSSGSTT